MKRILEIVMFSLVIITCLLSIYTFYPIAKRRIFPPKTTQPGEQVTGYDFSKYSASLLLVLRDGCIYCEANMPFYKILRPTPRVDIIYAIPGTDENAKLYVHQKMLHGKVLTLKHLGIKVVATQTMWLIDSKGLVVRFWRGEIDVSQKDEIMSILKKGL